jgi:hypothetical protein
VTDKQGSYWLNLHAGALELLDEAASTAGRAAVHPILVGLTELHDQRKRWLAWR